MLTRSLRSLAVAALSVAAALPASRPGGPAIAYIDPLSGAFANVGEAGLKHFQFVADDLNQAQRGARGEVRDRALRQQGQPAGEP